MTRSPTKAFFQGGVMYPWDSWRTLVPLIVGATGIIAFGFYERFVAVEPLIRLHVFGNRSAVVSYFGSAAHGMILWSLLYYLPLYYEVVKGLTPTVSANPPNLAIPIQRLKDTLPRSPASLSSPKPLPSHPPPSSSALSSPRPAVTAGPSGPAGS